MHCAQDANSVTVASDQNIKNHNQGQGKHVVSDNETYVLCHNPNGDGCAKSYLKGLFMIPLQLLVTEVHSTEPTEHALGFTSDCFTEAKQVQQNSSAATFAPGSNKRTGATKLTFRRMVHVLNKVDYMKELETNPAVRTCRYLKTIQAPVENGRFGEKEKAYIFSFDYRLMHTRLAYMDMIEEESHEDVLMDTSTQYFSQQSSGIYQWAVGDLMTKFQASAMVGDVADMPSHYLKVNNKDMFNEHPLSGSSVPNEQSQMGGQRFVDEDEPAPFEPPAGEETGARGETGGVEAPRQLRHELGVIATPQKIRRTGSATGFAGPLPPNNDQNLDGFSDVASMLRSMEPMLVHLSLSSRSTSGCWSPCPTYVSTIRGYIDTTRENTTRKNCRLAQAARRS